jgi:hypothetical protein
MQNTIFKDLFRAKFAQQVASEAASEAAKIYTPKTFLETYLTAYKVAPSVALIGGVVSIVAAFYFALGVTSSFCNNYVLSAILAASLLVGLEVLKSKVLSFSFKELFASRFPLGAIVGALALLGVSVFTSLEGAKMYVNHTGQTKIDSLQTANNTALSLTVSNLETDKKQAQKDLKSFKASITYKGKINTTNAKILSILDAKEQQINTLDRSIKEANEATAQTIKEGSSQIETTTTKTAMSTVIFCALIELLIVVSVGFRFYFLANVYRETQQEEQQQETSKRNTYAISNAMRTGNQQPTHQEGTGRPIGFYSEPQSTPNDIPGRAQPKAVFKICAHCGGDFERRTTWQKYCKEECKLLAHLERKKQVS